MYENKTLDKGKPMGSKIKKQIRILTIVKETPDCGLKRLAIKGGFGKGMAEVDNGKSYYRGNDNKKEKRKKVKEETKKRGRDRGKRREVT